MSNVPKDFDLETKTQVCTVCGLTKTLSEFYKRSSNKCKYMRKCKQCVGKEAESKRKSIIEKECGICGEIKPVEEFHDGTFTKDGYYPYCNDCIAKKNTKYYKSYAEENTDEVIARKDKERPNKRCSDCRMIKSKKDFPINKHNKDGHWSFCFDCERARNQNQYSTYLSLPYDEYNVKRKRRNEITKLSNEQAILICYNHYCNGDIKCANPYHKHDNEPERDMEVLVIDHVNSDGYKEVFPCGERIGGAVLARKLIKAGFPEGYQILCMSCNWKKRFRNNEFRSGKVGIGDKQVKYRTQVELDRIKVNK